MNFKKKRDGKKQHQQSMCTLKGKTQKKKKKKVKAKVGKGGKGLAKKKRKKKISKKKKTTSKKAVVVKPPVSAFKRALTGCNGESSTTTNLTGEKIDLEATALRDLNDTEVNELVNNEVKGVSKLEFETPRRPSPQFQTTEELRNETVNLGTPIDDTKLEHPPAMLLNENLKIKDTISHDETAPPAPTAKLIPVAPPAADETDMGTNISKNSLSIAPSIPIDLKYRDPLKTVFNSFSYEASENRILSSRQNLAKTTPEWIKRKEKEVMDRRKRNAQKKRRKVKKKSGAFSTLGRLALMVSPTNNNGCHVPKAASPIYTPWKENGNDQKLSIASRMMMLKQKQRIMRQR